MANFWQSLPKGFTVLAPMEDVTDVVFRQMVARVGRPDVFFTEFVSVDGLCSNGRERLLPKLAIAPTDHPIIAQLWGLVPENYYSIAQEVRKMGFAGVDINMGCPVHDVVKMGACSGLIKNPTLAAEIIQATRQGAGDLPVSVKTRIGLNTIITQEWIGFLLSQKLDALTVHGRTVKEQSKVPAHWDEISKAVKLRDRIAPGTILIGNGDVQSLAEVREKTETYGVDGVMIGRGIFHNIGVFAEGSSLTREAKLQLLLDHVALWEQTYGAGRHFPVLRKYFKIYVSGFDGASELRINLMEAQNGQEIRQLMQLTTHPSTTLRASNRQLTTNN